MTPDELQSRLWVRNFPLSATLGWGHNTLIAPQILANIFEARQRKNFLPENQAATLKAVIH